MLVAVIGSNELKIVEWKSRMLDDDNQAWLRVAICVVLQTLPSPRSSSIEAFAQKIKTRGSFVSIYHLSNMLIQRYCVSTHSLSILRIAVFTSLSVQSE